jgi:g-D-glutamyl-meso-diaminopimelate peptidase
MIRIVLMIMCLCVLPSSVSAKHSIVNSSKRYTYEDLEADVKLLKKRYPNLIEVISIGSTKYDRNLYAIKLGHGEKNIFINGAHHAREWMTTTLLMKMLEEYAWHYTKNKPIGCLSMDILNDVSIWFVPMVNPDGVTLQQKGVQVFPEDVKKDLILMNKGSTDFTRWKANGEGIDLNRQYPANWENLKNISLKRSYQYYKGKKPLQAIEARSLVSFTKEINPEIALSYHSSGRVLYWYYFNNDGVFKRDYLLARKIQTYTGYELVNEKHNRMGGGYTDWFIKTYNKPAFTPEISFLVKETNPPLSVFSEVWERNKQVGLLVAYEARAMIESTYIKGDYQQSIFGMNLDRSNLCEREKFLYDQLFSP